MIYFRFIFKKQFLWKYFDWKHFVRRCFLLYLVTRNMNEKNSELEFETLEDLWDCSFKFHFHIFFFAIVEIHSGELLLNILYLLYIYTEPVTVEIKVVYFYRKCPAKCKIPNYICIINLAELIECKSTINKLLILLPC